VWGGSSSFIGGVVSWPGRREGLPLRTVLTPVELPRRRHSGLRRLAVALAAVVLLVLAGAVVYDLTLGRTEHRTAPPPPARRAVPPRRTHTAPPTVAARQAHAITRLQGLGIPVFCGAAHGSEIALTFDDGPGPYTGRVLGVLRRYHATATFFLVGNRIRYWPKLPAWEAAIGAVGDHTWSHADLRRLPRGAARTEIDRARREIEATAHTSVRLFRTPYGDDPEWLGHALGAQGLLEIRWSVDPSDYLPGTTVAKLLRRAEPNLRPGAIVLLHDVKPVTLRALPKLLQAIRARHLRSVTVPELLRTDPPSYRQIEADAHGRGCVDLATAGRE
jgi:peptidoglycan/xylan/chitin deacetylase (PgdA/CDA1 family)